MKCQYLSGQRFCEMWFTSDMTDGVKEVGPAACSCVRCVQLQTQVQVHFALSVACVCITFFNFESLCPGACADYNLFKANYLLHLRKTSIIDILSFYPS